MEPQAGRATCARPPAACWLLAVPGGPPPLPHATRPQARLPNTARSSSSRPAAARADRPIDMAAGRGGGSLPEDAPGADLYAVLGLSRECTDAELRGAYRRLAMVRSFRNCRGQCCIAVRLLVFSLSAHQQLQIEDLSLAVVI